MKLNSRLNVTSYACVGFIGTYPQGHNKVPNGYGKTPIWVRA